MAAVVPSSRLSGTLQRRDDEPGVEVVDVGFMSVRSPSKWFDWLRKKTDVGLMLVENMSFMSGLD